MNKQTEALKLALEALESTGTINQIGGFTQYFDGAIVDKAISAIEVALAQPEQPQQEPVDLKQLLRDIQVSLLHGDVDCRVAASNALDGLIGKLEQPAQPEQEPSQFGSLKMQALILAELAQPKREWVELTDASIQDCYNTAYKVVQGRRLEVTFARAVLAKSKELNT